MEKPDVDEIEGLSPAIAIDQKAHSHNPRSTVATLTEIYDYLRVLFARVGKPFCPECGKEIRKMSADEIVEAVAERAEKEKSSYVAVLAPVVRGRKGEYFQLIQDLFEDGFAEARIDGRFHSLHERIDLTRYKMHTIEAVVDRPLVSDRQRLFEAVELALQKARGSSSRFLFRRLADRAESCCSLPAGAVPGTILLFGNRTAPFFVQQSLRRLRRMSRHRP